MADGANPVSENAALRRNLQQDARTIADLRDEVARLRQDDRRRPPSDPGPPPPRARRWNSPQHITNMLLVGLIAAVLYVRASDLGAIARVSAGFEAAPTAPTPSPPPSAIIAIAAPAISIPAPAAPAKRKRRRPSAWPTRRPTTRPTRKPRKPTARPTRKLLTTRPTTAAAARPTAASRPTGWPTRADPSKTQKPKRKKRIDPVTFTRDVPISEKIFRRLERAWAPPPNETKQKGSVRPFVIGYCDYPQKQRPDKPNRQGEWLAKNLGPHVFPEHAVTVVRPFLPHEKLALQVLARVAPGLRAVATGANATDAGAAALAHLMGLTVDIRLCPWGSKAAIDKLRALSNGHALLAAGTVRHTASPRVLWPRGGVTLLRLRTPDALHKAGRANDARREGPLRRYDAKGGGRPLPVKRYFAEHFFTHWWG